MTWKRGFRGMVLAIVLHGTGALQAQPTAFTYQGLLSDNGVAADGEYEMTFAIYDGDSEALQVGSTLTNSLVVVANGRFVVTLDFGSGVFDGNGRWLEIGVRPGTSQADFTTLSPRQQITATPYALFAQTAAGVNAASVVVTNSTTLSGAVQFDGNSAAPGYVWTATGTNGIGQWQALAAGDVNTNQFVAADSGRATNLTLVGSAVWGAPDVNNNSWLTLGSSWTGNSAWAAPFTFGQFSVYPLNYDDDRPDVVSVWGYNVTGGGAKANRNEPSFTENFESAWQNYGGLTQSEWYMSYSTPDSAYGTNYAFRPLGFNFVWNTDDRSFNHVNANINVDSFVFQDLNASYSPWSISMDRAGQSATITHYGQYLLRPDYLGNAILQVGGLGGGGNIQVRNSEATALAGMYMTGRALTFGNMVGASKVLFDASMPLVQFDASAAFITQNSTPEKVAVVIQAPQSAGSTNLLEFKSYAGVNVLAAVDQYGNATFANMRNGVANISDLATSVVVSFSSPLAGTNYSVLITPEFNTVGATWWVANKTADSFTFNLSTGANGGGPLSYEAKLYQ